MTFKSDISPKHTAFVSKIPRTHNKHWQSLTSHFHLSSQAIQLSKYVLFTKKHRIWTIIFIELLILAIVSLRNIIKNQVASVKVEQGKRYVEEAKLHKLVEISTMTVEQEQEKGSVIVKVDLKHTNQIPIVKVEQVK